MKIKTMLKKRLLPVFLSTAMVLGSINSYAGAATLPEVTIDDTEIIDTDIKNIDLDRALTATPSNVMPVTEAPLDQADYVENKKHEISAADVQGEAAADEIKAEKLLSDLPDLSESKADDVMNLLFADDVFEAVNQDIDDTEVIDDDNDISVTDDETADDSDSIETDEEEAVEDMPESKKLKNMSINLLGASEEDDVPRTGDGSFIEGISAK